eukprot:1578018-Rhodomonas_salina.7
MRGPVLRHAPPTPPLCNFRYYNELCLPFRYAMSDTETGYGATRQQQQPMPPQAGSTGLVDGNGSHQSNGSHSSSNGAAPLSQLDGGEVMMLEEEMEEEEMDKEEMEERVEEIAESEGGEGKMEEDEEQEEEEEEEEEEEMDALPQMDGADDWVAFRLLSYAFPAECPVLT